MRVIAAIIGIIGAVLTALRGFNIRAQLNDPTTSGLYAYARASGGDTSAYDMMSVISMVLIAGAVLGAIASLLLLIKVGSPKALAALLILAGLMPFINMESALFGVPMLFAGLLGFFVKKKTA